jgi:hypothetical protein
MGKLKICRECETVHYLNCPKCFGWGVKPYTNWVPLDAEEAHSPKPPASEPCPWCGCDIRGLIGGLFSARTYQSIETLFKDGAIGDAQKIILAALDDAREGE